ncbi:MAG: hypothetical protein MUF00_01395 [Gemmatimonadaceae bacterium]|jgi:hypothetical protein|nr:hypothetical protein [Gemmatimonadaceae bacterium]
MARSLRRVGQRALSLALVAGTWLGLSAHIGSSLVVQQGNAGPYAVRVLVRPPGVIPGLVQVTLRTSGTPPRELSVQPALWRYGTKGAPPPEIATPVPGEPGTFATQLWIMSSGSYALHVRATGEAGSGSFIVPFSSAATTTLEMPRSLGGVLLALGALLVVGVLSITGASAREATLTPGTTPDATRQRRARRAMAIAGGVSAAALFGGWSWWGAVDGGYRRAIDRPLTVETGVSPGDARTLTLRVTDSTWRLGVSRENRRARLLSPLMPDHGKLMHLFLVAERGDGSAAHLHPVKQDDRTFTTAVPELPVGRYWVFADVVHESGYARTFVDTVDVPAGQAARNADGDDAIALVLSRAESGAALADGGRMVVSLDGPPTVGRDLVVRARVTEADGSPSPLAAWMGMAGHAMLLRTDGGVFVHLHPMGSGSMAAQERLARREAGDTAWYGEQQPTTHAMHGMTTPTIAATGEVTFPIAFPSAGTYRVIVQVRRMGRDVETGMIEVTVRE